MHACVHAQLLIHLQFFAIPWTVACQPPLSVKFPRQGHYIGCHVLLQGIFPTQGSNLCLFTFPTLAVRFFTTAPPGKPLRVTQKVVNGTARI